MNREIIEDWKTKVHKRSRIEYSEINIFQLKHYLLPLLPREEEETENSKKKKKGFEPFTT